MNPVEENIPETTTYEKNDEESIFESEWGLQGILLQATRWKPKKEEGITFFAKLNLEYFG